MAEELTIAVGTQSQKRLESFRLMAEMTEKRSGGVKELFSIRDLEE